jgi:3-methyladenine DNA glycosylase AlkD
MPAKKKKVIKPAAKARQDTDTTEVASVLTWLSNKSTQRDRDNMKRFGITAPKFFGVSMANLKVIAKRLGRNHELAAELWATGWYEARMLATLIDEPECVTAAQMDRWCRDFDNWGIVDTACFALFDRTPHSRDMIRKWAVRRDEFQKRAAFALLACLALHDKQASDADFLTYFPLIEQAAMDDRNFVKKGVSWALRAIGGRSAALNAAAVALARRLATSTEAGPRWLGKDTLRDITRPALLKRLASKSRPRL